jgi:hypothetical protein
MTPDLGTASPIFFNSQDFNRTFTAIPQPTLVGGRTCWRITQDPRIDSNLFIYWNPSLSRWLLGVDLVGTNTLSTLNNPGNIPITTNTINWNVVDNSLVEVKSASGTCPQSICFTLISN